jgi:hypothetical protein
MCYTYVCVYSNVTYYQHCRTNKMHILYSVYYELTACMCFKHYLLIFRRHCVNNNWYIACILCQLVTAYYTDILQCTVNETLTLPSMYVYYVMLLWSGPQYHSVVPFIRCSHT